MRLPASMRAALGLSLALTATLYLAVGQALAAPGATTIALGSIGAADYALDTGGSFAPVRLDLIEELLGPEGLAGLAGGDAPVAASGDGITPIGPGDDPSGTPEPTPPPTDPTDPRDPSRDPIFEIRDPNVVLEVAITSDRSSATPGEPINYRVSVRNVGTSPASSVVVESHVPEHTVYDGDEPCGGGALVTLPGTTRAVCVDGVDGGGEQPASEDHIVRTYASLPVGGKVTLSFWVHVEYGTASGTVIRNHGHGNAAGAEHVTSDVIRITVA